MVHERADWTAGGGVGAGTGQAASAALPPPAADTRTPASPLVLIGRVFFALAFIGLGVEHFVFGDFIVGRAPPWPEGVPGVLVWAYLTGFVFVTIAVCILTGKGAGPAALLSAFLIFAWALLRNLPVVASDTLLSGAWTRAGKALTFTGGSLVMAATAPHVGRWIAQRHGRLILIGRICLGLFLLMTGIQHFRHTEFVASLIPTWFPGDAVFWTRFAGVALISGGVGLHVPMTARLAALLSGTMVFSWFWIVHVPRTFVGVSDSIAVFEALAVSGIAVAIAGYLGRRDRAWAPAKAHASSSPPACSLRGDLPSRSAIR